MPVHDVNVSWAYMYEIAVEPKLDRFAHVTRHSLYNYTSINYILVVMSTPEQAVQNIELWVKVDASTMSRLTDLRFAELKC
jgi:hypothetical protein